MAEKFYVLWVGDRHESFNDWSTSEIISHWARYKSIVPEESMININATNIPSRLREIEKATEALGFTMPSDRDTGCLLRMLCSGKPDGTFLEIGTGTGLSACWMLDGMSPNSRLVSVDNDSQVVDVAQSILKDDRLSFHVTDGISFIRSLKPHSFDLIFADAMPGKYEDFAATINLLRIGGMCVLDDMLPQSNWPENHQSRVEELVEAIADNPELTAVFLQWSTGIIVCTKVASS